MTATFDNSEEHEFSERLQSGDPGAVEELFTRYLRQVYSVVFHAVSQDHHTAEDITQETFLSAVRSAGRFKGKSKPYTWLLSIAHHKIADYYRKLGRERRYETVSLDSCNSERDTIADASDSSQS